MKVGQTLWTRDELIMAINLYCKLPFGKIHKGNPSVIELANLIGRTPSSVTLKLGNLGSFDPSLKQRGIKGASNASKLDGEIWNEFYDNWGAALIESEKILAAYKHTTIEQLNDVNISDIPEKGLEKERIVSTRVNQHIFRKIVLATYSNQCCITGISHSGLLVASHIVPWSEDEKNRLNPCNGLALNALHDKAFDNRLMTIDADDFTIRVSSSLKKDDQESIKNNFLNFEGKTINLPKRFLPHKDFLSHHNAKFIA